MGNEVKSAAREWAVRRVSAHNQGHGHVHPRPDGVKARCGGPALCAECAKEYAAMTGKPYPEAGLIHVPESNLPRPDQDPLNDKSAVVKHALKVVQAVIDHYPTTLEERSALNKAYAALLMIDQRTSAK